MEINIDFQDNSRVVLQELKNKMPDMLYATGMELHKHIYDFMTEDKVVDTGRLRGSISFSTPYANFNQPMSLNTPNDFIIDAKEDNTVVYGSNVEYANYVETGTTKQRARGYLKTGTYRAVPVIKDVVEKILKGE